MFIFSGQNAGKPHERCIHLLHQTTLFHHPYLFLDISSVHTEHTGELRLIADSFTISGLSTKWTDTQGDYRNYSGVIPGDLVSPVSLLLPCQTPPLPPNLLLHMCQ